MLKDATIKAELIRGFSTDESNKTELSEDMAKVKNEVNLYEETEP